LRLQLILFLLFVVHVVDVSKEESGASMFPALKAS
jgi:hypothetical protein